VRDICRVCAHNPHVGALRCTGGFHSLYGWADPVRAEEKGYCPFFIPAEEAPEPVPGAEAREEAGEKEGDEASA